MATTRKYEITNKETDNLMQMLLAEYDGRYHYRNGVKRNVKTYSVAWIDGSETGTVFGHLTGKGGKDVKFSVRKGLRNPLLRIEPGASGGSLDMLEQDAKEALKKLIQKMANAKKMDIYNTKNWDGYYLYRNSNPPGKKGLQNMQRAIDEGEISASFRETCFRIGIRMKHFIKQ